MDTFFIFVGILVGYTTSIKVYAWATILDSPNNMKGITH